MKLPRRGGGRHAVAVCLLAGIGSACGAQLGSRGPAVPPQYAMLPDTLVCVVDRGSPAGLRQLPAKLEGGTVVILVDGEIRPLEAVHPVSMIAGYAGREPWLTRGDPITLEGRRYLRTGGERRVGLMLLRRLGEHQGILLFAGQEDPPPADALYVPTAPGCIFQPYVREDLIRP
jgi:hypothetical protein